MLKNSSDHVAPPTTFFNQILKHHETAGIYLHSLFVHFEKCRPQVTTLEDFCQLAEAYDVKCGREIASLFYVKLTAETLNAAFIRKQKDRWAYTYLAEVVATVIGSNLAKQGLPPAPLDDIFETVRATLGLGKGSVYASPQVSYSIAVVQESEDKKTPDFSAAAAIAAPRLPRLAPKDKPGARKQPGEPKPPPSPEKVAHANLMIWLQKAGDLAILARRQKKCDTAVEWASLLVKNEARKADESEAEFWRRKEKLAQNLADVINGVELGTEKDIRKTIAILRLCAKAAPLLAKSIQAHIEDQPRPSGADTKNPPTPTPG